MDMAMEIKEIKDTIINFLRNIFKEVKTLPNIWLYILLSVVLTFIFLIFTFPYNALIRNQLQSLGENIGKSAYIGNIDFSLINPIKIENMTIILKDGSEIALQNINLDMGVFSALLKNSIKGNVIINNIKYEKDKTSINIIVRSDFNLNFKSLFEYPDGSINLELQNVIANGITIKGFDIPPVRFSSIIADLNIIRKKLNIDNLKFTGPDLKGNISGSITLAKFFKQSQLNLNVSIDSSSTLLENYKILLDKWIDDSNKIKLMIRGAISNPRIDSNKVSFSQSDNVENVF